MPEHVTRIADQATTLGGPSAGLLVITAAWTGCRWGELAGLQRDHVHDDFSLEAVPHPVWFKGVHVCLPFLERRAFPALGGNVRLLPTRANGQPAAASYRPDASGNLRAEGLWVFTIVDGRFSRAVKFQDPSLVTAAGLPAQLAT